MNPNNSSQIALQQISFVSLTQMTKVKIYSCFTFLLLFAVSCGNDYGNKLESDEIDVFYINPEHEELARNIANYWKENDLLGSKKQSVQLDEENDVLVLKIIPTEKYDPSSFSFDERALLKQLQDSLQSRVHPKRLEIVIANTNFETVHNIN